MGRMSFSGWARAAALVVAIVALGASAQAAGTSYARIGIDGIGHERLARLAADPAFDWWVELDGVLLVAGAPEGLTRAATGLEIELVEPRSSRALLYFVAARHPQEAVEGRNWVRVLASGGRWSVVESRLHLSVDDDSHGHIEIHDFVPNTVLARQAANLRSWRRVDLRGGAPPVDQIDADRWYADVTTLAGWNRYTRGPEIDQARDWLAARFAELPGLVVSTPSFQFTGTTAYNVFAWLEGSERPDDWYIVGAHYDSISEIPNTSAPGAEDNASGCAGVLEMARVITQAPPGASILFACYSGEEQGLHGSTDHASDLVDAGDDARIRAVLTMDMIGFTEDADLDVLLETDSASQFLIDVLAAAAAQHTNLRVVTSLFPFGSDHVPYLNRGMPALLSIENDWDSYSDYHRSTDLPANVSKAMGGGVLRMNLAALWAMASGGCADADADGYGSPGSADCTHPESDCDDTDPAVNPGAVEIPGNGIDDDCDPGTPSGCQESP